MPTDEQRALWAAIWADPADDTARLVYADWLQENGDEARAEFIQLQIEQTQLFSPSALCSDPNERTLTKRETRLISHHRERWLQPLSEIANQAGCDIQWSNSHKRVKFARGFPRDVGLSLHAAYRVAARGSDIESLDELKIERSFLSDDTLPFVATIARWSHAACVTEISIPEVSDEVMRVLTGGQITRLRTLDFAAGEMTEQGAKMLANWHHATTLQVLNLWDSQLTDAGAIALAESPHLRNLKWLQTSNEHLTAEVLSCLGLAFGNRFISPF